MPECESEPQQENLAPWVAYALGAPDVTFKTKV